MDSLAYGYNFDGLGNLVNNRLRHVKDPVSSVNYTEDIDNQSDDNYTYDSIGNMISDAQAGISAIEWTVYGKIRKITKASGDSIVYTYDASGNRISKAATISSTTTKTIYVRDASGNVMSLYAKDASINSGAISQTEISMYGSSRLGVWNINRNVDNSHLVLIDYSSYSSKFIRGNKLFELSNHLGNVLATISDKHIGVDSTSDGIVDYYNADVVTANDYYPFGMEMPGRKYNNGSAYRYGFNGKENDNEVKGEGNEQDYGMRIYDSRLGKFLSVDPLTKEYPWNSTYAFAENDVIRSVDLDGLEKLVVTEYYRGNKLHHTVFSGMRDIQTKNAVNMNMKSALKIKLTTQDVYLIKRDMNENVISEAPAGKLDNYYQGIVAKAKMEVGEEDDKLPENTMQQTMTTGRGRFIKSALVDNIKNEFFGLKVLNPQLLPPSISAKFNITSLNQSKIINGNEISDDLNDVVDFLKVNPKIKITLTAYMMGYKNMRPLNATDIAHILEKAAAVKKLLISKGAKASQIKTASGGSVIDFDKVDKVEIKL